MNITTKVILDTRKEKKNGKYPVKLRVTYNRQQKYFPYGFKFDQTKEDFELIIGANPPKRLKDTFLEITSKQIKAEEIIRSLGQGFTFTLFAKMFDRSLVSQKDVFRLLEETAKKLRENDQISTAVVTECFMNSLKKFHLKDKLNLDQLDAQYLMKYERWMQAKGKSNTTIGMYGRTLRSLFNQAIKNRVVPRELYPFNDYQIPTGRNIKKAIPLTDISLIFNYKPKNKYEEKARDYWMLSYFLSGANMKDLALLKFKNIDGDMIRFERAKTKKANKDRPVIISCAITPEVQRILKKWGNKSIYSGTYILPIFDNNCNSEEQYRRVQNAVKTVNKYMKDICDELKIKSKITLYSARHSFATVVRNSGKSIEFISDALGHSSIQTTRNYLAGFEDREKKNVAEMLVEFAKTGSDI